LCGGNPSSGLPTLDGSFPETNNCNIAAAQHQQSKRRSFCIVIVG
jgi:hypothetical protein